MLLVDIETPKTIVVMPMNMGIVTGKKGQSQQQQHGQGQGQGQGSKVKGPSGEKGHWDRKDHGPPARQTIPRPLLLAGGFSRSLGARNSLPTPLLLRASPPEHTPRVHQQNTSKGGMSRGDVD